MNFLNSLLLASALVAVASAACNVCTCSAPELFSEEYFNEKIGPMGPEVLQTRTFINVTSESVVGCVIKLECDFGDMSKMFNPNKAAVTIKDETSMGTNLNDVTCKNGKWWYQSVEVKYVGCYKSVDF